MRKIIILLFIITVQDCSSYIPRKEISEKFFGKKFQIIAHRGMRNYAPENSMSAFRMAHSRGFPFELDVMFCRTGELVVFHDETVDRVTGKKGKVADLSLSELKALDSSVYFRSEFRERISSYSEEELRELALAGLLYKKTYQRDWSRMKKSDFISVSDNNFLYDSFKGEKIPLLEEVLDEFGGKALIDIEIKSFELGEKARKVAAATAELIRKKNLVGKVFVTSFNPYVLEETARIEPDLIRGQLYSSFKDITQMPYIAKVLLRNLYFLNNAKPEVLALGKEMAVREYVQEKKDLGFILFPWTVNDPEEMKNLIENGVDGLITDRPELAEKVYKKYIREKGAVSFSGVR
ncbi:MAG TPA: glycerophosphodiester phosphodiesterase family protein [Leptospiraceae bacterium]|nr:glycerophosphodiester phosphodiesterase family protein [Leptospiraceae bacterium]